MQQSLEKSPIEGKIHLVGFGKGAAGMVSGVIESVGKENIHSGMVSVPVGTKDVMKRNNRLGTLLILNCKKSLYTNSVTSVLDQKSLG